MPTRAVNPRELRVSDTEREHVVAVLEKAIGRGTLGLDEFTSRTDDALAAQTRAELNIVLADLPGLVHRDAAHASAADNSGAFPPPTDAPGDRLELNAHGSALTRSGVWAVPGELVVRNRYAETKLDFTEAQVSTPVVHIELHCRWGQVTITIPEQAAVDINGITEMRWGSLDDKTGTNGKPGTPRYVITGRLRGGFLTIRHPHRGMFGC